MALQVEGAGSGDFGLEAATGGRALEFEAVMDGDAVVADGDDGVGGLLAVLVELGGGEVDVVGLPLQGREAHVHLGRGVLIDAAALVIEALEAEAVEDLDFVAVLEVQAAIGATLAAAERLERQEEFEVQFKISEGLLGLRVGFEEAAGVDLAVDEGVGVLSIEEDGRTLGGGEAFGRAVADGALERDAHALDRQPAVGEGGGIDVVLEEGAFAVALAFDFDLRGAVPTCARQAALEEHEAELVFAEGDDVRAHLGIGVFTLQLVVRVDGGGFRFRQVDGRFRRLRGGGGFGFRRVGGEKSGR